MDLQPSFNQEFILQTEDLRVEVLGTRYQVEHNEQGSTVAVTRGAVGVTDSDGNRRQLRSGQQYHHHHAPAISVDSAPEPDPPDDPAVGRRHWQWSAENQGPGIISLGHFDQGNHLLQSAFSDESSPRHALTIEAPRASSYVAESLPERLHLEVRLPAGGDISLFLIIQDADNRRFVCNYQFRTQLSPSNEWQTVEWDFSDGDQRPVVELPHAPAIQSIHIETIDGKRPFSLRTIFLSE